MRIRVVLMEDDQLAKMQAAFEESSVPSNLEVLFTQAPSKLDYVFPFPFVQVEAGDGIQRRYGEDAEQLYYATLAQHS